MSRGPAHPVPFPPADLASRHLPLRSVAKGTSFLRVHSLRNGAIFFSPGEGKPPLGRFDSAMGRFGVLYLALSFEASFAETLLRNPARSIVGLREIEARARSAVVLQAATTLVDLTGPGLSQLGLDARFLSGSYDVCGAWADALHDHPATPGGIAYPSRFDPSQTCVAVFGRLQPNIATAGDPLPLTELLPEVAAILDRYGKALDPG